jgi:hypothetical protein
VRRASENRFVLAATLKANSRRATSILSILAVSRSQGAGTRFASWYVFRKLARVSQHDRGFRCIAGVMKRAHSASIAARAQAESSGICAFSAVVLKAKLNDWQRLYRWIHLC